ncbi:MAG TPA: shikimate kinase [Flavobacterium sp.]|nr:shikimate kinase [Flavobacterium sp.]
MHRIILTGYMGSGKTTVGLALAQQLSIPFFDLDEQIENETGQSISEIFKERGSLWFRKKEHTLLNELMRKNEYFVLSLGGGTPCYANNHLLLQSEGISSFYLKANVATLVERLSKETEHRPLLKDLNTDLASYIGQHLFERTPFYNYAKHTITIDKRTTMMITEEIIKKIVTI